MVVRNLLALLFLLHLPTTLCTSSVTSDTIKQSVSMYPMTCSDQIKNCSVILYQNNGLQKEEIATYYSVNVSDIKPFTYATRQDYFVTVPCSCKNVSGTVGYFYDTVYVVKPGDSFVNVSAQIYSGQAWPVGGEEGIYVPGKQVPIHLLCGCVQDDAEVVVTYTVQEQDTLSKIGTKLSAEVSKIQSLNMILAQDPTYINVGWVLFIPREKKGIPAPDQGKHLGIIHPFISFVRAKLRCTLLNIQEHAIKCSFPSCFHTVCLFTCPFILFSSIRLFISVNCIISFY